MCCQSENRGCKEGFFLGEGVSDVKHFYLLPAGWPLAGEQGGFVI